MAERVVALSDSAQRPVQRLGHGDAGPLGDVGRVAIPAMKAERGAELASERLELRTQAFGSADVVGGEGLVELDLEVDKTALVGGLRLLVEHGPRVVQAPDPQPGL